MIFFFFAMIFVIGCSDNSTNNPSNTVSDTVFTDARDGKKYGLIKIGTQIWMSKNLDVSTYRNGETIRHASTKQEWLDAADRSEGAWSYYDHDPKNGAIYGKLYNWFAVSDSRGLTPAGYHIPSDTEWTVLTDFLGGEAIAEFKMKSTSGWANGDNGDNSSGFNGLPGGYWYRYIYGSFYNITESGSFWSFSESDVGLDWSRNLGRDYRSDVSRSGNRLYYGLSVRCLRD